MVTELKITGEMTIGEIVTQYPETVETLMNFGVHCVGCDASPYEALEDGFRGHGMSDADIQDALVKLNEVVEKSDHSQTDSLDDAQVSVTAAAVSKIKEFIAQQHKKGLRITVHPGGCSGFKYGMTLEDTSSKDDIVIEQQGIQVFIDKTSMMKLNGASIDYVDSLQGAGFKISNPQAKASCGCGNSFR